MFKLIRRISSSVFPRNDRPWADDATSTAPTIGVKRRRSSVDVDLETPVETLSKKSRRVKGPDLSDDEEPSSSPVASSPLPPRSSPPPEEVKEVTTGVREIELDRKLDTPLSDPSEVVQPPVTFDTETPVESEEGVKAEEDVAPEQRSEEENTSETQGSPDPVEGDVTNEHPVDAEDAAKAPEEDAKPAAVEPTSHTKVLQSKSTEPVTPEGKPEVEA
ncbi:hypothetical protein BJ322DRAFT_603579 [Thelephora terrestris]|uniref:Uncharacterized protein n=1 Tax=Thelephora terrestris TaxID=56493 RepID=A0A9P6HIV1_9AGAM|nr:hypothetical protein BJ322DRAFT_603579 [Thelephora terrestris]